MAYTLGQTSYGPMAYLRNDIAFIAALHRGKIYEQELVETVLAPYIRKANIILDIGAHAGSHSLIYAAMSPDATIYAYEPQRALRDCLKFNLVNQKRPNIIPIAAALGNKRCTAQMHATIPDGPNCNKPINDTDFFNFGGRQLGVGGEVVEIYRLDDLWPAERPPVDFIKIDVEGFEDFVVDGGRQLIERCRPVVFFEHNEKRPTVDMEGYYDRPSQSILEFFSSSGSSSSGYSLTGYEGGNYLAIP